MVGSIKEVLKIQTVEQLKAAFIQLETDIDERVKPLEQTLDKNIFAPDIHDLLQHAAYVEAWRSRLGRWLYLVSGFVSYAKSSQFLQPVEKGITEAVREAHKKSLAGPYEAMQQRLEHMIDSVDSRVNMVKKKIGMESEIAGKRQMAA